MDLTGTERRASPLAKRHLLIVFCLSFLTFLFFVPLFLHPHWGTLDDSILTVQPGRRIHTLSEVPFSVYWETKRPGIFIWVLLLWRVFAENPLGYYAVNCIMIAGAAVLLYCVSFKLTRSSLFSVVASLGLFLSSGFFEVAYTLDKQEAYLPLLFSVVIMCHLCAVSCRLRNLLLLCLLDFICSSAAYISKESALVLIIFSGSLIALSSVRMWLYRTVESTKDLKRILWIFSCTLLPLLIQRMLSSTGATNGYIVLDFNAVKLLSKGIQYCEIMPEFFSMLLVSILGWICHLLGTRKNPMSFEFCVFTSLLISTLASTFALLSFDTAHTLLLYIWFPIYCFLLTAFACALTWRPIFLREHHEWIRYSLISVLLLCFVIVQAPRLFVRAQFQYSMDVLTAELCQKLSNLAVSSRTPLLGAMPLFSLGANEIPGHIEFFVRNNLIRNYYASAQDKTRDFKFAMLSCLSPHLVDKFGDGSSGRNFVFKDFYGNLNSYESECPASYVGWSGFQLVSRGVQPRWVKRTFDAGDLLIVPYGSVNPMVFHRGVQLFQSDWRFPLSAFPQLKFEEVIDVSRRISEVTGKAERLGWKILKVASTCPVAMESCFHSLQNGGKIYYRFDPSNPVLSITVQGNSVSPIAWVTYSNGQKIAVASHKNGNLLQLQIPLIPSPEAGEAFIQLSWPAEFADMTIDALSTTTSLSKSTDFYISQDIDGWLKNNSVIVYPSTMNGKKLCMTVDMPGATCLKMIGQTSSTIKVAMSPPVTIKASLSGGLPTADGRSYLLMGTDTPLKIPGDPRKLALHVSHFVIE